MVACPTEEVAVQEPLAGVYPSALALVTIVPELMTISLGSGRCCLVTRLYAAIACCLPMPASSGP